VNDLVVENDDDVYYDMLAEYNKKKMEFKYKKKKYMDEMPIEEVMEKEMDIEKMKPNPKLKPKGFRLNEELYKELTGDKSLFVIDDYQGSTKGLNIEKSYFLMDIIASTGRHEKISLIDITHLITDGNKTRLLLNEVTTFVIYSGSTAKSTETLLKHYLGFDTGLRRRILRALNHPRRDKYANYICINVDNRYCISNYTTFLY